MLSALAGKPFPRLKLEKRIPIRPQWDGLRMCWLSRFHSFRLRIANCLGILVRGFIAQQDLRPNGAIQCAMYWANGLCRRLSTFLIWLASPRLMFRTRSRELAILIAKMKLKTPLNSAVVPGD